MTVVTGGDMNMIPEGNVLFGVPKKGRLYDRCMKLLAGAGMDHHRVRRATEAAVVAVVVRVVSEGYCDPPLTLFSLALF